MWNSNIYYNPDHFGLETVGEVEYSSGIYEFDTIVVWRDPKTNEVFAQQDSGCSCPSPFEDHNRKTLIPITKAQDLIDILNKHLTDTRWWDDDNRIKAAIGELVMKTTPYLKEKRRVRLR